MNYFFMIALVASSYSVMASDRIVNIRTDKSLVSLYLDSGEIVKFDEANNFLKTQSELAKLSNLDVEFKRGEVSADVPDRITEIKFVQKTHRISSNLNDKEMYNPERLRALHFTTINPLENSNIDRLDNVEQAQDLMNSMNGKTSDDSQCFNRAHMWTYEVLVKKQKNLGKLWIFFTERYIDEFDHKWWFHIAPYADVNDTFGMYVLDRGFTMFPYTVENWKNIFLKNKANCPVIQNYNDYRYHQENEYCYLIKSTQYYWQPQHLENLNNDGTVSWGYKIEQLERAYEDALIRWDGYIPRLSSPTSTGTVSEQIPNSSDVNSLRVQLTRSWLMSLNQYLSDGKLKKDIEGFLKSELRMSGSTMKKYRDWFRERYDPNSFWQQYRFFYYVGVRELQYPASYSDEWAAGIMTKYNSAQYFECFKDQYFGITGADGNEIRSKITRLDAICNEAR